MNNRTPLNPKLLDQLFNRLRAIWPFFGTTWKTKEVVDLARKEWATELSGFSGEELSIAINQAKVIHKNMAPTLPQFKDCALGARKTKQINKADPDLKYLNEPRAPHIEVKDHIANMRNILKKARSPDKK